MKKEKRNVRKCNKFQRKGRFLNAKNDSCCAWLNKDILMHHRFHVMKPDKNDFCGVPAGRHGGFGFRAICCKEEPADSIGDCDAFNWPKGVAFDRILEFAGHEDRFYAEFLKAWKAATENGFPKPLTKMM